MDVAKIRMIVTERLAQELGIPAATIDPDATAADLGLGSAGALRLAGRLEQDLDRTLPPHILFDYPTINRLAQALVQPTFAPTAANATVDEPIAIVGIGCRFPGGVTGPSQFLEFLRAGGDGIVDVPTARWNRAELERLAQVAVPSGRAGLLQDIDRFDAALFGILPAEAADMDPQQRLLLETAWHALEDAGLDPKKMNGTQTGVFVGISANEYDRGWPVSLAGLGASSPASSALSIAANRLSYTFDLRGPSVAVDTACSSSLSAVHLACQALRNGDAELALAGGVNAVLVPDLAVAFGKAGLMAPDGFCKAFDDRADGYVRGEGCGLVVLKRLAEARRDGDPVYAVILATAVGQDGRSNGLMAPRGEAQSAVIAAACARAGIVPSDLDYLEAHGTGTAVGDVIEAHAISAVAALGRPIDRPLRLGSVKSNIGHLEAAAGVAGLIKTSLSIWQRELLPGRHFLRANSRIDFDGLQLEVVEDVRPWPGDRRRIAGVSSFGFGGTNVHAVLAEDNELRPNHEAIAEPCQVMTLSANSAGQLLALAGDLAESLAGQDESAVHSVASGMALRHPFAHRAALVVDSPEQVAKAMRALADGESGPGCQRGLVHQVPKVGFVFPGQGALWPRAGLDLFEESADYRDALIACDEQLRRPLGRSVLEIMFGSTADADIARTEWAQPALFAIQYALAKVLGGLGIKPAGVVGHSVGEVAAACVAGRISLEDAAQLIVRRARAMADTAGAGRMLAVHASPEAAQAQLRSWANRIVIAAVNGPAAVVLSGEAPALRELAQHLRDQNIACVDLGLDYAFHSPQMDRAADLALSWPEATDRQTRDLIYYASTLGDRCDNKLDNAYWSRNLRDPVLFAAAIAAMRRDGFDLFIEVGPDSILARGIGQMTGMPAFGLMQSGIPACKTLATARAKMFVHGADSQATSSTRTQRGLGLPPTPMAGERFWRQRKSGSLPVTERLLDPVIVPAVAPDHRMQAGVLSLETAPFVRNHVIQGRTILPAAGSIALFAAAATGRDPRRLVLDGLTLSEPVTLAGDVAVPIQLAWQDEPEPKLVLHRLDHAGNWRKFASATLLDGDSTPDASPQPIEAIRARCLSNFPGPLFYALLRDKGLEYGPDYCLAAEVHACRNEALARLDSSRITGRNLLDTQVLDACLHPIAAAISPKQLQDRGDPTTFVPSAIAKVVIRDCAGEPCWSHAVVKERSDDQIVADVMVLEQDGALLGSLTGVVLRSLRRAPASQGLLDQALENWVYGLAWTETAWPEKAAARQPSTALVLSDQSGLGEVVVQACRATGARTIRLDHGAAFKANGADHFTVPPGSREAIEQALELAGESVIDTVIDLWPLDSRYGNCETLAAFELGPKSLVALVQALDGSGIRGGGHLTVVTEGGLTIDPDEAVCPHQATISGLIRAIGVELPALRCKMIDVRGMVDPARILLEACTSDGESQLALRAGKRWAARLRAQAVSQSAVHRARPPVRDDATYLITGGMGALGLTAAKSLAAQGARHLILAGRSAPTPALLAEIDALRTTGANIRTVHLDVSDRPAIDRMLAEIGDVGPALGGIVHCAGQLDDCAITNLTPDRFDRVLMPKLAGALHLHEATCEIQLDFFVCYSSAAAVFGAPGQANYCAANAGLDALALHRQQQGLAGLSLGWGAWGQAGMAKEAAGGIVASTLVSTISHDVGGALLGRLLASETGYRMVVPFSIPSLLQFYPSSHGLKLFAEIAGTRLSELRSEGARESRYCRPTLSTVYRPPSAPIEQRIAKIWESSLNIEGIGVDDDLFELGGDSVLANQILSRISEIYGIRIEGEAAFTAFTITHLAQLVDEEFLRFVEDMADELQSGAYAVGEAE